MCPACPPKPVPGFDVTAAHPFCTLLPGCSGKFVPGAPAASPPPDAAAARAAAAITVGTNRLMGLLPSDPWTREAYSSVMDDEQYEAVTVGRPPAQYREVVIADYDPIWPHWFESAAFRIREALRDKILQLDHVGSTSVRGLPAKPLIDINIVVADTTDEDAYVPPLEAIGYVLRIREPDWFEHRMLRGYDPPVNLHVFNPGCEEIERMLRLRDHLRTHEDDRELYARTKRELAAKRWKYVQNYADAKSEVIQEILARAVA
jgi:GrpB-like predicted nucleotidyltransferase (UPF0157 family)